MNAPSQSNRWLWIGGFAVVLLTLSAHLGGLQGQFVEWDDTTHITQNPAIRALTPENLWVMFTQPIAKLYIPLTWLSFALDYQIWGRDPFGYHFTNLVLHLANTALVIVLAHTLLRDRLRHSAPAALLAGAVFGVHPLRVESVAWATERKDVLFALFFLLALIAYLYWLRRGQRRLYWWAFALFVASALSKPAAVTLPGVLLLVDFFWAKRNALREKIPFFVVSILIGMATFVAQASGEGQTVATTGAIPVWARAGLVGYCSLFYVQKFVWPLRLSAIYPTFDEMGWTPWVAIGWLLALALVTAVIVALRRRAPLLLASWLFYLVTLSPTIGLVPVGIHVVADRFSYMPLLGLALPLGIGLALAARRARVLTACFILLLLSGWALQTARRTAVWANTETLFHSVLREYPNCLPAHVNLTVWYTSQKRFDEAIAHGQRAVQIAPEGLRGRKNLAYALINAGRHRQAIRVLRVPVERGVDDPDVWRALLECFQTVGDEKNAEAVRRQLDWFGAER